LAFLTPTYIPLLLRLLCFAAIFFMAVLLLPEAFSCTNDCRHIFLKIMAMKLPLTPPREIFETGLNEGTMREVRLACNPNPWTGSSQLLYGDLTPNASEWRFCPHAEMAIQSRTTSHNGGCGEMAGHSA
jgi:hypothetical protein